MVKNARAGQGETETETILLLRRLQQGDEKARELLIANHHAFITKMARRYSRETGDILQTDAYSVALIAFNEAADRYSEDSGVRFTTFAGQVMKRRLIDLARSDAKFKREVPVAEFPDAQVFKDSPAWEHLADDIAWFENALKQYRVSLEDLVRETPRHKDTRCLAIAVARRVVGDPDLLAYFRARKTLPFKSLLLRFRCNPKTIQRHRKYIIAVCIALGGSSSFLRDYVLGVAEGCDNRDA